MNYTAYAWLPGTPFFVAEDSLGQIGFLSPEGFEPRGENFLKAATLKYNYRRLAEPVSVTAESTRSLAERLAMP